MRERNSDFARLACSALALSRRACSARLRSVMSQLTPVRPVTLPCASRLTMPRAASQCSEPSG